MSKYTTPQPSELVKSVEKRFVMPKITLVQVILVAVIIAYAWSARKMNGMVVGTLALTVALLHMYDHLYLVKRGPERSLIRKPERYRFRSNRLRQSLEKRVEQYSCQSCK
jgi:hypothetical protein